MLAQKKSFGVLYIATFPPRECGIATFTADLSRAIAKKTSPFKAKIAAINKGDVNIYNYPSQVILEINDSNIQEYIDAAKKINAENGIQIVNIQHEFGLFGGEWGSYLIPLLAALKKPIIITFHSVIPDPERNLKNVVRSISRYADCLVVMTNHAKKILEQDYGIKTKKINIIPHGIPALPFAASLQAKKKLNYQKKIILSSFGLISENKGYEYVIEALPAIIEKFPNLLYLIIGETHPVVRSSQGEQYRNFLEKKVQSLGIQRNVKFYNKYLALPEIIQYLQATDIYISSSLDPNQAVSGTLAYALGCGRAVVSTPFAHAREAISQKNGILADFKKPASYTAAILKILGDPPLWAKMEKEAYARSREATWPNVALSYLKIFQQCSDFKPILHKKMPKIRLKHLIKLTDQFGIIQFASGSAPDRNSGYSVDDAARALIVLCLHYQIFKNPSVLKIAKIYLRFIQYVQAPDGRFFNFVSENKKIDADHWSEDAHGRGLWALGVFTASSMPAKLRKEADRLYQKALAPISQLHYPRAIAFSLIGLCWEKMALPRRKINPNLKRQADRLIALYRQNSAPTWQWFEPKLYYSNAKLPEALLRAYLATRKKEYLRVAEKTLGFLSAITFKNETFTPIGQKGWYAQGGSRAYFDQQPEEVAEMVQALALSFTITKKKRYLDQAREAFQWFLGENLLNQIMYDEATGGCHDGLGQFAINLNQGAESTISYLLARLTLEKYQKNSKP